MEIEKEKSQSLLRIPETASPPGPCLWTEKMQPEIGICVLLIDTSGIFSGIFAA